MRERPLLCGPADGLVGIVSEPLPEARVEHLPACILLNAGLVHRVGPNRLHVRVARALAAGGSVALRLDLSGRGDSEVRKDAESFVTGAAQEIRAAMDALQATRGCDRFVLMGICSGAVNALQVAIADPRVTGGVLIDGPAYPTVGYYARYYARRLFSPETWRNTIAGQNAIGRAIRRAFAPPVRTQSDEPLGDPFGAADEDLKYPPKAEAEQALRTLTGRGVKLLFIFTGSWTAYNYRGQFRSAFGALMKGDAIQVEYFPDADHTFTCLHNQQRLVNLVTAFFDRRWPPATMSSSRATTR